VETVIPHDHSAFGLLSQEYNPARQMPIEQRSQKVEARVAQPPTPNRKTANAYRPPVAPTQGHAFTLA